ncbi:tetratricopeptide repeat protein [Dyella sedimenti]|uniref:tetratricopeptide repeat protein n=1 Tax=Dyella sedimenti TaxID=2919947 RepID=UPI001FAA19F7|nr:sel1 repeat family protein [Dyella sedimenti]
MTRDALSQSATGGDVLSHLLRSDPARAHGMLLAQALAGDCASQLAVGQMYLGGIGCERDGTEARYWFQHAAHQGAPMAMHMLGRCHENGWGGTVDVGLAAVWYRESAEHGLDLGMYHYANALAQGRGVSRDRAEAFRWFSRAAEAGHGRAMHFLGQYYEYGWETEPDMARACELYRRSAEAGDYRGQCSWASVLTGLGRVEEACALLRAAIAHAPDYFVDALRGELEHSRHPALRALAGGVASAG